MTSISLLQLYGEYCRKSDNEWTKILRASGTPRGKMRGQRFICTRGAVIEKGNCFPTTWFSFKNGQEANSDDCVPIADCGVPPQGCLTLLEPDQEWLPGRELMLRERHLLFGVGIKPGSVSSPRRVGRGGLPGAAHGSQGEQRSRFAETFF